MAKILVADDDPEIRKVIGAILTQQGFEIIESADGSSTCDAALSEKPDLILLDIVMPRMSGFEVMQKLKNNPVTRSIPIIVVSALKRANDEHQAMRAGALDYIIKPWAPGELEDRIRIALPNLETSRQAKSGSGGQGGDAADGRPDGSGSMTLPVPPVSESIAISTGSDPMDRALLGGLPLGALTLLEGASGTGKSVLCQHLAFGALMAELGVAYYVQAATPDDLITQMGSLGMDVKPHLGEGQLLIHLLKEFDSASDRPGEGLRLLKQHITELPWDVDVIVGDSLTNLVTQAGTDESVDFFMKCDEICRREKALLFALHTAAFDPALLSRLHNMFNTHLSLRIEGLTNGLNMKTMNVVDVTKVKNRDLRRKTSVFFEVDPELGRSMNMSLKVLPFFKIRA